MTVEWNYRQPEPEPKPLAIATGPGTPWHTKGADAMKPCVTWATEADKGTMTVGVNGFGNLHEAMREAANDLQKRDGLTAVRILGYDAAGESRTVFEWRQEDGR